MFGFAIHQPPPQPDAITSVGRYRIIEWRHGLAGRVIVKDRRNRVVAQVFGFDAELDEVIDHGPRGFPEVMLETRTEAGKDPYGYYLIEFGPRPRCLMAYWGGVGGYPNQCQFEDLNHDGHKEIVSDYDAFTFQIGVGGFRVLVPIVMDTSRGGYIEATRRYPKPLIKQANSALRSLKEDVRDSSIIGCSPRADAVSFLACKILLGQESGGWKVLKAVLPPNAYGPLWENRAWIRRVIVHRKRWIRHLKLSQIPLEWGDIREVASPFED